MNKDEFKEAMKHPKNIYCLVSSDAKMIDLYKDRFKDAIKADQVIFGKIQPTGLLFKRKTLNVVYMPKLEEDIFERKEFIFIHTDSIDKRTAVFKKYKDQIIILENDYTNYIINHSNMNEEQAKLFAKRCKNDLGIIENELLFYNTAGINYNNYEDDLYLWVDCFLMKKPLPNTNESEISMMALLSNNCQDLLKVKQNNTIGMNPYRIVFMNKMKDFRSEEELINMIKDCFFLDCQVKKGLIEPKYTIALLKEKYYAIAN